jgi:hypothetical protein
LGTSLRGLNSVCGGVGLFQGGCGILCGDLMVNLWCDRGGLCGGCGVLADTFLVRKNVTRF